MWQRLRRWLGWVAIAGAAALLFFSAGGSGGALKQPYLAAPLSPDPARWLNAGAPPALGHGLVHLVEIWSYG